VRKALRRELLTPLAGWFPHAGTVHRRWLNRTTNAIFTITTSDHADSSVCAGNAILASMSENAFDDGNVSTAANEYIAAAETLVSGGAVTLARIAVLPPALQAPARFIAVAVVVVLADVDHSVLTILVVVLFVVIAVILIIIVVIVAIAVVNIIAVVAAEIDTIINGIATTADALGIARFEAQNLPSPLRVLSLALSHPNAISSHTATNPMHSSAVTIEVIAAAMVCRSPTETCTSPFDPCLR
jgi:hypothetical protein